MEEFMFMFMFMINLWNNVTAVTAGNQDKWLTMDAAACSIIFMWKLGQKT